MLFLWLTASSRFDLLAETPQLVFGLTLCPPLLVFVGHIREFHMLANPLIKKFLGVILGSEYSIL